MNVDYMRAMISGVYEGAGWRYKVNNMSNNQVIAIYYDFLNRGKFDKDAKPTIPECGIQLSIFDLYGSDIYG